MKELIKKRIQESIDVKKKVIETQADTIARMVEEITSSFKQNGKVIFFGNGGSAADSQHVAAEFIGRFERERKSLPAIALTTDTSILTALGNDYGFESVFSRQLEGIGKKGDVAVAISTSGNSPNVLEGVRQAKKMGIKTLAFTGRDGGKLAKAGDVSLIVPSDNTARIQEAHICIFHIICELVENNFSKT